MGRVVGNSEQRHGNSEQRLGNSEQRPGNSEQRPNYRVTISTISNNPNSAHNIKQ